MFVAAALCLTALLTAAAPADAARRAPIKIVKISHTTLDNGQDHFTVTAYNADSVTIKVNRFGASPLKARLLTLDAATTWSSGLVAWKVATDRIERNKRGTTMLQAHVKVCQKATALGRAGMTCKTTYKTFTVR